LQPQGKTATRSSLPKAKSSPISTNNPEEARVSHTLNLQFDEYGNVLESASRLSRPLPTVACGAQAKPSSATGAPTDDKTAGHPLRAVRTQL
jgi:hypothetical protein